MLNASVIWDDIDAGQWANLWRFIHSPERSPTRAIGLLREGVPFALVSGRSGQISLDAWPYDEPTLDSVAERLRKELDVDQVILIEESSLSAMWDEQQRFLDPDDDYDDYLFAVQHLTDLMITDHAVCAPAAEIKGFPPVPYEQFRDYIAEAVGDAGSFLITVFDRDSLWWSLAGLVSDKSIVRLTSSQGLFPADAPPPLQLSWSQTNAALLEACKTTLGPVRLALSVQLSAFEGVLRASNLPRAIERLEQTNDLTIWRHTA